MKKYCGAMVSVLFAAVSVSLAQNSVPYQDTYEQYTAGSNLVGTVWQGDTSSAQAVVTNGTPDAPSVGYPVPAAPHTQVMAFSNGPITNEFDGTTSNLTVVAIDTMVQPVFAEPPAGSQMAAVSNSQMSLYVDTNGYLNVYHGYLSGTIPGSPDSTQWTTLTGGSQLTNGSWCRLTVVMNYDTSIAPIAMFKVGVNGTFINSSEGYLSADVSTSKGGPWFISPTWTDADLRMHRVVLSGTGKMDDMVVATNEVAFTPAAEQYTTNGTSVSWLQAYFGNTNTPPHYYANWDAAAADDPDQDGAPTWAEFIAGTDPTNATSKLVIVSSTFSNGVPILKWIGSSKAQSPYSVEWSSNLMSITSWSTPTSGLPQADGTNQVTLPAPTFTPAFMRVNVTSTN